MNLVSEKESNKVEAICDIQVLVENNAESSHFIDDDYFTTSMEDSSQSSITDVFVF